MGESGFYILHWTLYGFPESLEEEARPLPLPDKVSDLDICIYMRVSVRGVSFVCALIDNNSS